MQNITIMKENCMIKKPDRCIGCPFYEMGKYFTPDNINPNSKVLFVAQNPGEDEELGRKLIKRTYVGYKTFHSEFEQVQPQPLIGATGKLFREQFLPLSGLKESEISLANALRCRPGLHLGLKTQNDLPPITIKMKYESSRADIVKALRHCHDSYFTIPNSTELIVAMGGYALFQLTGEKSVIDVPKARIYGWRGYILPYGNYQAKDTYYNLRQSNEIPVLSTMHIAALFRGEMKKFYHATLQDFHKIKKILNKQWPLPLPRWNDTPPNVWPSYSSFDTEFTEPDRELFSPDYSGDLIRWSLCDTDNNLYVVEAPNSIKIQVEPDSTILMQNAPADYYRLAEIIDVSQIKIEDLMLAHSVLYPGEPHGLNYQQSIFGEFNKYKHLSTGNPQLYSALDAYEPLYIWRNGHIPEFRRDKASWKIYKERTLPLISIITKAQQRGIRVDQSRLRVIFETLTERVKEIQNEARLIIGNEKFNIGGRNDMLEAIYGSDEEEILF